MLDILYVTCLKEPFDHLEMDHKSNRKIWLLYPNLQNMLLMMWTMKSGLGK